MKKINFFATAILMFGVLLSLQAQNRRSLPFSWDNASVYFMLTDRFNNGDTGNDNSYGRVQNSVNGELDWQGGDFKGVTDKINSGYFDDLGISAIWVTPPVENIHGSVRDHNFWGFHGYWTKDWTSTDANLGSMEEFRIMVDAAHDHGIRIVMDIVLNHTGYETWTDDLWPSSWVRTDCEGGDETTYCPLAGLPDIRSELTSGSVDLPWFILNKWESEGRKEQELAELDAFFSRTGYPRTPRNYIIKWLTDYVRELGIDGFRVDTAKHVGVDVWKDLKVEATNALREWKALNPAKKPDDLDFWMTAEVYGQTIYDGKNYYFENGFDNIINFDYQSDLGNKSQEEIFSTYADRINNVDGFNVLSYIASHDVGPYDRSNLYYAGTSLLLTPGGIQIYYGDESGRPFFTAQTPEYDAGYRAFMNWDDIANNPSTQLLLGHWQKLGQFRREHLSVGGGSHQKLSDSPYIFRRSYNKNGAEDNTLVAMDIPENSDPYTLNVYGTFVDGTLLKDYFSGNTATVTNGQATFQTIFGMLLVGIPFDYNQETVSLTTTPPSGNYIDAINVSMSVSSTADGTTVNIYYTEDGSEPNENSQLYTSSIVVSDDKTIKARAYDSEGNSSNVITNNYTIGEIDGLIVYMKNVSNWGSVNIHYWNEVPDVLPTSTWPGPNMTDVGDGWFSYTFDGVTSTNLLFSNNSADKTGDMFRDKNGWYDDGTWFDIDPRTPVDNVPTVSISPAGGSYTLGESISVSISATDDNDTPVVYYTTDGSTPSLSSALYSASFDISADATIKAIAYDSQNHASTVASNTYTFTDPAQGLTVYMNNVSNWSSVNVHYWNEVPDVLPTSNWPGPNMTDEGDGWFSYTFDGVTSTNLLFSNNSADKTGDMFRDKNGWYDDGTWFDTDPRTPQVPQLSVDNSSTSFTTSININLSATESGVIYYTIDGSTPSESSTMYSGSLTFTETTTLNAQAFNSVGESNLITETYTKQTTPEGLTLHCKKPSDWSTVYIYFWNTTGVSLSTGWPGQPMNDDGNGWYSYTLDGVECTSVIFNNNSSPQTSDYNNICQELWYDNGWVADPFKAGVLASNVDKNATVFKPYPNPFNNELSFSIGESNIDVKIHDLKGSVVFAKVLNSDNRNISIQPEISKGIYIMHITTNNKAYTYKIVKQ